MKQLSIYIFLLLITFSCNDKTEDDFILPKGRTVLVYIAGDGKPGSTSNLSSEVAETQEALMEGWSDEIKGSLIVFADRNDSPPVLVRIGMHKNKIVADTLRSYSNENSASPELLQQVIGDTQLLAPGESYGLVLFSHASGWLPEGAFKDPAGWGGSPKITPRSILEDQGREMELADFVAAIPDGMFEFIASEMCFMSSVETAYALRNKTKYLLASAPEVLSPGFRPIYKTSLNILFEPEANLEGFGQAFFDYHNGQQGVNQSAAISLVKTSEMEALATFTRGITPKLTLTQNQIDQVQHYDGNPPRSSSLPHLFFDFRDYINKIATPQQMLQIDELLSKTVIFKRNTPKLWEIPIAKHSGLSVYIPQASLPNLNAAYKETDWYKAVN